MSGERDIFGDNIGGNIGILGCGGCDGGNTDFFFGVSGCTVGGNIGVFCGVSGSNVGGNIGILGCCGLDGGSTDFFRLFVVCLRARFADGGLTSS